MRIVFTPQARAQFLDTIEYIRRDNPSSAMAFRRRAEKVLARLRKFPYSGRTIPEFPDLPHREVILPPYRFFYRVVEKVVWVVAVWHSAQDVSEPKGL